MTRDLSRLTGRTFDLLIIGGGIVGAGIAWDAALRGLSVALVEKGDFASGTSSKTTKLIHGGIRYLEQLEFKLVAEAIQERALLLKLAPDLVKPLPFLIPVVGNRPRPWFLVRLGVALYDLMAGRSRIQSHQILSRSEVVEKEPILSGLRLKGGALYFDAQMDDVGLVLATLEAASRAGAILANHACVTQFLMEGGRIVGADIKDELTGTLFQVKVRVVINATGPWADHLRRLADPHVQPIVRMSKGIHLVYPDLGLKEALVLSSSRDNRIFFLIPWKGNTLIGTTDTDYSGDPGEAKAEPEEIDYLIEEVNQQLPHLVLEREKILSTFAGVRPLVARENKDPWAISRTHLIFQDSNGLISVVGGKFTTFRKMAQEVVDRIVGLFPGRSFAPCRTHKIPLKACSSVGC